MENVKPPIDIETHEGEIAIYWMQEGILFSLSNSTKRTVANISENIKFVKKITNDKKMPLLIYLTNSPVPDKATRKFSTEQLPVVYKAMAMVSKPGLSKFIINILFRLSPPPIPMKSFTDDKEAKEWLKQFVKD